jgi:PDZ domain-containing protein
MPRAFRYGAVPLLVVASFAAGWIPLPYYSLGPGPAREVLPLVHVEDVPTYPSEGRLVMTTVRFRQLTALGMVITWLDPEESVVEEDILYPPGVSRKEEELRAISQMDQSKIDAAVVVLSNLTDYPREHGRGALIEQVGEGCPADGELFTGDLVVRIDGSPVASAAEAADLIDAVPVDEPIRFRVEAEDEVHDVVLRRGRCPGLREPLVGIAMVEPFPFELSIESDDVGGPSAGLMWALGLYDLLTPGDVTGGRTIAGTGSIDGEGNIGPIGGVLDKVVAARHARADLLLVPEANAAELRGAELGGLRVVAVSTFEDALEALGVEPSATAGAAA